MVGEVWGMIPFSLHYSRVSKSYCSTSLRISLAGKVFRKPSSPIVTATKVIPKTVFITVIIGKREQ